jgi:hypothetical protein
LHCETKITTTAYDTNFDTYNDSGSKYLLLLGRDFRELKTCLKTTTMFLILVLIAMCANVALYILGIDNKWGE